MQDQYFMLSVLLGQLRLVFLVHGRLVNHVLIKITPAQSEQVTKSCIIAHLEWDLRPLPMQRVRMIRNYNYMCSIVFPLASKLFFLPILSQTCGVISKSRNVIDQKKKNALLQNIKSGLLTLPFVKETKNTEPQASDSANNIMHITRSPTAQKCKLDCRLQPRLLWKMHRQEFCCAFSPKYFKSSIFKMIIYNSAIA